MWHSQAPLKPCELFSVNKSESTLQSPASWSEEYFLPEGWITKLSWTFFLPWRWSFGVCCRCQGGQHTGTLALQAHWLYNVQAHWLYRLTDCTVTLAIHYTGTLTIQAHWLYRHTGMNTAHWILNCPAQHKTHNTQCTVHTTHCTLHTAYCTCTFYTTGVLPDPKTRASETLSRGEQLVKFNIESINEQIEQRSPLLTQHPTKTFIC